jgi:hypothetical protein
MFENFKKMSFDQKLNLAMTTAIVVGAVVYFINAVK